MSGVKLGDAEVAANWDQSVVVICPAPGCSWDYEPAQPARVTIAMLCVPLVEHVIAAHSGQEQP